MTLRKRLEKLKMAHYSNNGLHIDQTFASIKKDLYSILNEPSDTVKKGDTAFTALEKFRAETSERLERYIGSN